MRSEAESAGASGEGGGEIKSGGSEEISLPEEKEEPAKKVVWMVDDNLSYARSALLAGRSFEKEFSLINFPTGEEAEDRFHALIEQHGRLPDVVLMDYQLDKGVENPKYRTGDEVIRRLQSLVQEANLSMPEIFGISGDEEFSKRLLEAGAVRTVGKLKLLELFKELSGQK